MLEREYDPEDTGDRCAKRYRKRSVSVDQVALSSITALFGTVQIAANGVAQSFWSVAALMGTAWGLAFITVIGQCMGAGDRQAADYYMRKLLRITFLASVVWNGLILFISPLVLQGYALSPQARKLTFVLILIHNIFNALFYPLSGALSNGLRAAGDVKFTMYVSIFSTISAESSFSVIFGIWMNLGVIGVAFAMCLDWGLRALLFWIRFQKGKMEGIPGDRLKINARLALRFMVYSTRRGGMSDEDYTDRGR